MRFSTASLCLLLTLTCLACDTNHSEENPVQTWLQCQMLGDCEVSNTRFGMVGDSWTDLVFGTGLYRDMHDWLVLEHGYRITSANFAGQTLQAEVNSFHSYRKVIKNAGPDLRYMLISLGGNDLLANISEYTSSDPYTVLENRLAVYQANWLRLTILGDAYKQELYGGPPLVWIVHGYDYGNPAKITQCNFSGYTVSQKEILLQNMLDRLNTILYQMSISNPNIYHIDLRGTLGGPPISDPIFKVDCIHPSEQGFALIAARYAASLQLITQDH